VSNYKEKIKEKEIKEIVPKFSILFIIEFHPYRILSLAIYIATINNLSMIESLERSAEKKLDKFI